MQPDPFFGVRPAGRTCLEVKVLFSGYRFALMAERLGRPIAAINRGRTRADALLVLKLDQDAAEALGTALAATG